MNVTGTETLAVEKVSVFTTAGTEPATVWIAGFILVWGVTPGDAQGLLLTLHSGATLGSAQGTPWGTGD